ncbi:MAG: winged helix-turn-helix transcriptional regulator [Hyphomonadaceae bacterium]|nr:winged helix-turn-helix transcriptional regulator [Hyphomonadaceae bacterium]
MDIELLVNISSKAWALKILALLDSGVAGRQAPLLAATKATRPAFAASLKHLAELNLLERNPGHGHPLRPEFRLTPQGIEAAAMAGRVINAAPDDAALGILKRTWSVPILAIARAPTRYSTIKTRLGKITDRALSQSLFFLEERDWLAREIIVSHRAAYPTYRAIEKGAEISRLIQM